MKQISDLTISKISELIAVSPSAFSMPACHPDRPIGGYRTWPNLLSFLKNIDPLIPGSETGVTNFIHEVKETPTDKRYALSRENVVKEILKIWNKKDPNIFIKVFNQLLDPKYYFPGEEPEILRVYGIINASLSTEGLFLGGFPLQVIDNNTLTVDEKAQLEWDFFWYLSSKIYLTNLILREKVSSLMLQGAFGDATRNAAELPFAMLRNKFEELKSKDGEELIAAALRKNGILFYGYADPNLEDWSRKKLAAKLSALYQAYRNPSSHHYKIENPWESMLAIWNSNWCIGEIEKLNIKQKEDLSF
ncbi:MAG: hypothetical protein HY577_01400, partial [Candidatus Nealsonbacteria bacterium]|nr:hypothetical protein [Candidatus Nealsonbacteria bacterium]